MENEKPKTLLEAMAYVQGNIVQPQKNSENPAFKSGGKVSKYADLSDIMKNLKPALQAAGLVLIQNVEQQQDGLVLKTTVAHVGGEKLETIYPMFVSQMTSQGLGSALTYARRYSICPLFCIVADDDDDGNEASGVRVKVKELPKPKSKLEAANPELYQKARDMFVVIRDAKNIDDVAAITVDPDFDAIAEIDKEIAEKIGNSAKARINELQEGL